MELLIGERLRKLRHERDLTQDEVASVCNVEWNQIVCDSTGNGEG